METQNRQTVKGQTRIRSNFQSSLDHIRDFLRWQLIAKTDERSASVPCWFKFHELIGEVHSIGDCS